MTLGDAAIGTVDGTMYLIELPHFTPWSFTCMSIAEYCPKSTGRMTGKMRAEKDGRALAHIGQQADPV